MRSIFYSTLFGVLIVSGTFWYLRTSAICPAPIAYRLGDVDERFGVTVPEAQKVLANAEAIWEVELGRDLFVYDETSEFAINFIYDERQQLASTEEEWRIELDAKEIESQQILSDVRRIAAEISADQEAFVIERERYETRLTAYNNQVAAYNSTGGAPKEEYAALQETQKVLAAELTKLLSTEADIRQRAEELNEFGETGNQLIELYNREVVQYNEIYGNIEQYTQGDFKRERINVYKFSDTTELTKVIAHEFGHALGVGHVEGEGSLMYYLMAEQPETILLSEEDKTAFIAECGSGNEFSYEVRRIIRTALSYL
jgi:prefoldin subunit 5